MEPRVDELERDGSTVYRFTVVLKDEDASSAGPTVEVVIDDRVYVCTRDEQSAGPSGDGVEYSLEADLGPGAHLVYFTADDGHGGVATTDPSIVTVEGPAPRDGPATLVAAVAATVAVATVSAAAIVLARRRRPGPP